MSDRDVLGLLVDELGTRARLPWRGDVVALRRRALRLFSPPRPDPAMNDELEIFATAVAAAAFRLWGQPWRLSRSQAVDRIIAAAGAPEAHELQRHADLFRGPGMSARKGGDPGGPFNPYSFGCWGPGLKGREHFPEIAGPPWVVG